MSVRRTDPRFTLPMAPERAVVLGDLEEWRAGLLAVGVGVQDETERGADLVVAPSRLAGDAVELGPAAIILEGRDDETLARSGFGLRHFLPRPRIEEPSLLVPLEQPLPAGYAVRRWSVVDHRWKAWRSALAAALLERGKSLPLQPTVTVATRKGGDPYLVAAARRLGVPSSVGWVLALGQGDVLSRNVFHLFPEDAAVPAWVLKFARVAGYPEPFDRDERGLAIAAACGAVVQQHAPRLLGRFVVDGVHASLETAAVGHRLRELLQIPGARRDSRALVDDVATWIIELAVATAVPPEALADERRRLLDDVVPHWRSEGASADLVTELPPLPAVTQHNDLGSWNLIVEGRDFTAVDWESARARGLPLWDLLYFLADALAVVDGAVIGETRHEHTRRLFRGELPSSEVLFGWVRRAVAALAIPREAVGAIATLCWLHHSLSHVGRSEARQRLGDRMPPRWHGMERNALMWLRDPALGAGWDQWRR